MAASESTLLSRWYSRHGRHDLAWRQTTGKWVTLVSEVMLQQTPVARVEKAFDTFITQFPTPQAMAHAPLSDVVTAWDRLGYPRRARNLHTASKIISEHGWPDESEYELLPGVGSYTAHALRALCSGSVTTTPRHFARDVNINRVCTRRVGSLAATHDELENEFLSLTKKFSSRDGLLAVMDLGSTVCTKTTPSCASCPVNKTCATQGVLESEPTSKQKPYVGSFRQKRGEALRLLRIGPVSLQDLDEDVVISLEYEGFIRTTKTRAFLAP